MSSLARCFEGVWSLKTSLETMYQKIIYYFIIHHYAPMTLLILLPVALPTQRCASLSFPSRHLTLLTCPAKVALSSLRSRSCHTFLVQISSSTVALHLIWDYALSSESPIVSNLTHQICFAIKLRICAMFWGFDRVEYSDRSKLTHLMKLP